MCLDRNSEYYVHENVELSGITKQIMPGPSGDLEEWQTLEVNVTLGFASGDTDLLSLPFLKVTLEPRHYLYNNNNIMKWSSRSLIMKISSFETPDKECLYDTCNTSR